MNVSEKILRDSDSEQEAVNHQNRLKGPRVDTPTRLVEALVVLARKKRRLTARMPDAKNLNEKDLGEVERPG